MFCSPCGVCKKEILHVSQVRLSSTTAHLTMFVYLRPLKMPPILPLPFEPSAEAAASLMMLALEPLSSKQVKKAF